MTLKDKGKLIGPLNTHNAVANNFLDMDCADDDFTYDLYGERKRRREHVFLESSVVNNNEGTSGYFLSVGPGAQAYWEQ